MKMKEMLVKCPKCGNQDKTIKRGDYGEISGFTCDNCGYIFEKV